jgi:long-chain fatty acid transport protein
MHSKIASAVAAALAVGAVGTLGVPGSAAASGFALPEISALGAATANAVVANPKETGAIPYNAAAMGFQGTSVALGTTLIGPNFTVTTSNGQHDSNGASWVGTPLIQAAVKINEQWRVGFGVNAPFGLETRWPYSGTPPYGTFPLLSQSRQIAPGVVVPTGNHPTASRLEILDFVPAAAYRINKDLSLAAGLDVYWAKSAQLDSNLGQMSGDGTGVGFNLGALYRLNALTLGASWHSAATLGLDGNYTPMNNTLVALGRLQPAQPASLDLNLPWRVQLGARYAFTKALAAELDWTYTGWNSFNQLVVNGSSGAVISTETEAWGNASAYRLGLTWQVQPATQLRCGYAYDQTGQGTGHFSPRVPDNNRQLFSLGAAQDLGNGFSVEASYMYVLAATRNVINSTPYTGGEVNGTSAVNGKYEMNANVIALEVTKTF